MMRVYNKVPSMTRVSFPLLGSISAELNWPARPVSTRWAGSNAPDKWPSAEDQRHARICGGSVTPGNKALIWNGLRAMFILVPA